MTRFATLFAACAAVSTLALPAARAVESCTTQSQMKPTQSDELASAAEQIVVLIQAGNDAGVRARSIAELQSDFAPVASLIGVTAPHLRGAVPGAEQVYLLDASTLARTAAGVNPDAQFFCTLNQGQHEADFTIPQLPPGRYGFAMVEVDAAQPYRVSMLLRQESGKWLLAGLYPRPLTANGHDGLWFWKQARALGTANEPWNAWLYLQEAQALLVPAPFVSSTHIEKLSTETGAAAPPAVSGGLSTDHPLVIPSAAGSEFRVTALSVDDSLGPDKLDVTEHIKVDALGDGAAARQRNLDAAAALVAAHPELRKAFHGVWVFADAPGASPYGTELAMADIR